MAYNKLRREIAEELKNETVMSPREPYRILRRVLIALGGPVVVETRPTPAPVASAPIDNPGAQLQHPCETPAVEADSLPSVSEETSAVCTHDPNTCQAGFCGHPKCADEGDW